MNYWWILLAVVVVVFMFSGGKVEKKGGKSVIHSFPTKLKSSARSLTSGNKMVIGILVGLALCWFFGNGNLIEGYGPNDLTPPNPAAGHCDGHPTVDQMDFMTFYNKFTTFYEGIPGSGSERIRQEHLECNNHETWNQIWCIAHRLGQVGMGGSDQLKERLHTLLVEEIQDKCPNMTTTTAEAEATMLEEELIGGGK